MKNRFNRLRAWMDHYPLAACFLTALALNLIVEILSRRSLIQGFVYLGTRPLMFLYNTIIIFWCFSPVSYTHLIEERLDRMDRQLDAIWHEVNANRLEKDTLVIMDKRITRLEQLAGVTVSV